MGIQDLQKRFNGDKIEWNELLDDEENCTLGNIIMHCFNPKNLCQDEEGNLVTRPEVLALARNCVFQLEQNQKKGTLLMSRVTLMNLALAVKKNIMTYFPFLSYYPALTKGLRIEKESNGKRKVVLSKKCQIAEKMMKYVGVLKQSDDTDDLNRKRKAENHDQAKKSKKKKGN